ncbi:Transient receptor potential cation channel, subf amily M, member 2 isoform LF-TRPM2 [Trichuris trichiura]|uniref:Transient receptor potential cation channel, subf amily M, member 2 isoform LF-TRPM2 n=1 Tax=Trichuris trichiura TaxID=36087 RepID=A0A077YW95_TRITR|nr:Transient receptor potential cation channel, subf amily M, member 2 isoform LF-TRPM2 [Trichuris trichiura]
MYRRRSIFGKYDVTKSNVPLNPIGRTGLSGRGLLPRYGPNHLVILILKRISVCEQYAVTKDGAFHDIEVFPSLYWGVAIDNRNTDNAWVEQIVWKISDRKFPYLGLMDFSDNEDFKIKWKCMNKATVKRKVEIARKRNYVTVAEEAYRRWVLLKNKLRNRSRRQTTTRAPRND